MALDPCKNLPPARGMAPAIPSEVSLRHRVRAGEKGAEMLEFGLVVAMLMTLMVGLVTFARAYNVWQTMTRAAREGAREAVLPSSVFNGNSYWDGATATAATSTVFANYISPALRAANLDPAKVSNYTEQVQWLNQGDADQQCGVVISFQYPYTLNVPFTSSNLTTITLSTQVQMRQENVDAKQTTTGGVTSTTVSCP